MATHPVRVGIVGLGAIGERLINTFKTYDEIEIKAVCDIAADRAKQVGEELGGVEWYTDHKALIAQPDVDLVYVAVPPIFHQAITLDVLQAKKHVLCEKPLANSVEEAKSMLEAAQQADVVHAMNFPLNYSASTLKFLQLIQEGYIGDLRRIGLLMHFPQWPREWQQNDWVGGREQGGYILEVGAHFIQLIQKAFGPITEVQSELQFPEDPKACESGVVAKMRLADGTPILVDGLSHIAGEERLALTAYGSKGTLSLENWRELKGGRLGEPLTEISIEDVQPPQGLMPNVVKAIRGQSADLYDFKVGYDVQVVLEALRHPQNNR
jgi:predicted dehydrogenase